jgi:hypothetical protein
MAAFQAETPSGKELIVLEEQEEGCYIFVFRPKESSVPSEDYLEGDLDAAKRACLQNYKIPVDRWAPSKTWVNLMDR